MEISNLKERSIIAAILILSAFMAVIVNGYSVEKAINNKEDSLLVGSADSILSRQDSIMADSVAYASDSIFYSIEDGIIKLSGNSKLSYHTSNISADTITINLKKEQAFTSGKAYMKDRSQHMLGNDIYFDLESEWGMVYDGASEFDKGYYYGDEIRKIDKETFDVDGGVFTTCDAYHPHFYIRSKQLRLYKDDKIIAKPITFYVNHFPIMMLPFGTFTIKRGRQTGILVPSPGWNQVRGKYIENIAFYYAFKDYADATIAFDYYEKTGWQSSFRSKYIKRYVFNGYLNTTLQKRIEGPEESSYEWNVKSRHHHDFGNNTTLDANLNFVSSKKIWEGSESIEERLVEKVTSSLSYKRRLFNIPLTITSNYIDDLKNNTKDITLPYISYSLPSKPIYELFLDKDEEVDEDVWWKDLSYSYNFKGVHKGDINDSLATFWDVIYQDSPGPDSTYTNGNQHNFGVKHSGGLRYSHKLKGWLNLSQSISGSEVWFDRDELDNKFVRGNDYSTNSSMSFNLYGLRRFDGFYVSAIRHIISPSMSFSYQPDFTENEKFYSFDGISLKDNDKYKRISLSLNNKWQLKLAKSENKEERKLNDFVDFNSSMSYDFEKDNGFGQISHSLDLNPGSFSYKVLNFSTDPSLNISQEPYKLKLKSWDYKNWDWGLENWSFSLANKLEFSGDAHYVDYFPLKKSDLVTGDIFSRDTLSIDDNDLITSLDELDKLDSEKKNWSVTFTHSYRTNKAQYELGDYKNNLRMALSAKLTKNWSVSYSNYIDLKSDDLVSYNFTLTRNLHCWKVFFRFTKHGDYWNYRFQLFNIQLPDALKFRTSDHKS